MECHLDTDEVLPRFTRLLQDVMRGDWRRNSFETWEVELLLDIQACAPAVASRRDLLPRYQKAVQRQMSRHRGMPMKLSEYIESLRVRQESRAAVAAEANWMSAVS